MTMTDNQITVTHLTDQPAPADELVRVPAADVVIEDNVRTIADLDPAFVASIKQHGVLLPTIGYRNTDGQVVVRDGQLRVLAARDTGHDVPVFVTARDVTDAQRLVEQVVTNDRRTALTDGDRLAAYRQMELAGLSVTAIVKQTGTKRQTVKDTLKVANSTVATAAVADRQLSFDDALLFVEFEGDEDAIATLNGYVDRGQSQQLALRAEEIRQDRARKAAVGALTAEYEANGVRVIDQNTDPYTALYNLSTTPLDANGLRTALTGDEHTDCAGRAVFIQTPYWGGEPSATEVCTTPEAHHRRHADTTPRPVADLSDEEREERRAAGRILRANNREWDAAETIRREWVASFLQRRTMPKDAALFVATGITANVNLIKYGRGNVTASGLLGVDDAAAWLVEHPSKAIHAQVAVVCAAYEDDASRDWWRYDAHRAKATAYLGQLATWGYPLSPVEQIALGITNESDDATTEPDTAAAEPDTTGDLASDGPITADEDPEQPDAA